MYSGAASGAVAAAAVLGAAFVGQHSLDHSSGAQRVDSESAGAAASPHVEAEQACTCASGSDSSCPEPVCECIPPLAPLSATGSEGASTASLSAAAGAGAAAAGAGLSFRGSRASSRPAASRSVDAATQTPPQDIVNVVPKAPSSGGSSVGSSTPGRVSHGRRA